MTFFVIRLFLGTLCENYLIFFLKKEINTNCFGNFFHVFLTWFFFFDWIFLCHWFIVKVLFPWKNQIPVRWRKKKPPFFLRFFPICLYGVRIFGFPTIYGPDFGIFAPFLGIFEKKKKIYLFLVKNPEIRTLYGIKSKNLDQK